MSANETDLFNSVTGIQYEQKAVSESLRLSKHAKTLTTCLNPKTETTLGINWIYAKSTPTENYLWKINKSVNNVIVFAF